MTTRPGASRRNLSSSPFRPQPEPVIEVFVLNDLVSHDLYGVGTVISAEEGAVTVNFGAQSVRIVSPYKKMEKL
jgi:hypothetical protein